MSTTGKQIDLQKFFNKLRKAWFTVSARYRLFHEVQRLRLQCYNFYC